MPRVKIIYGQRTKCKARLIDLGQVVGKTIEAVGTTTTESAFSDEPCIMLYFKGGTRYAFVVPDDAQGTSS